MHEPGSRETPSCSTARSSSSSTASATSSTEGDSVTFDADLPHHFENNASSEARLIAVVAAGLRRG